MLITLKTDSSYFGSSDGGRERERERERETTNWLCFKCKTYRSNDRTLDMSYYILYLVYGYIKSVYFI